MTASSRRSRPGLRQWVALPDGLMVHLGYEDGDDLVLVEAWRTEDLFESYYRDLLHPALGAADLRATVAEISAALSIARP